MSASYHITRMDDRVRVKTMWSDVPDGYNSMHQDFANIDAALVYTGGCRYNMREEKVDVLLDGIAVNANGLPTDEYAGSENGWSFGTDNDD